MTDQHSSFLLFFKTVICLASDILDSDQDFLIGSLDGCHSYREQVLKAASRNLSRMNQGEMTAQHTAWRLLETQLSAHEAPGDTTLHRAVLTRLLRLASFPPCFLLASYKQRNPPELVRIYLRFGRLREAADIACEYLQAILGRGSEYFGVSETVLSGRPACLPLNTLDRLLYELDRPKYKAECENLQGLINYYIQNGTRVS